MLAKKDLGNQGKSFVALQNHKSGFESTCTKKKPSDITAIYFSIHLSIID
jgi:hypothetical protein